MRAATTRLLENSSAKKSWNRSQPAAPTVRATPRMNPRIRGIGLDIEGDKESCDQVVDHAGFLPRPIIIGRGFTGPVDEMNSGAGRTLQRDVCQIVICRQLVVKPSPHILSSRGASIKERRHQPRAFIEGRSSTGSLLTRRQDLAHRIVTRRTGVCDQTRCGLEGRDRGHLIHPGLTPWAAGTCLSNLRHDHTLHKRRSDNHLPSVLV
jgi:hypothetical protein